MQATQNLNVKIKKYKYRILINMSFLSININSIVKSSFAVIETNIMINSKLTRFLLNGKNLLVKFTNS